ncbi:MAG: hypothetical protein WEB57_03330, partial [Pseudohongiellaceae bacterium]
IIHLNLDQNNLAGSIPSEIGSLTSLHQIHMGGNQLGGTIPASLAQLENLSGIWLWSNQFGGAFPAVFTDMTQLSYLALGGNQFSGEIPAELGNLTNLRDLNLGFNAFSGPIPAQLGNLDNLTGLFLTNNQFSGAIPAELGSLASLERMDLARNLLTGTIPAELGNLSNLQELRLNHNLLSGAVPAGVESLPQLTVLDVWANMDMDIALGSPAACDSATMLGADDSLGGELTPFEDCYIEELVAVNDFFDLELQEMTVVQLQVQSDSYYPRVGVLSADGAMLSRERFYDNSVSMEVLLPAGRYMPFVNGGTYNHQYNLNVPATGAYNLSSMTLSEPQAGCQDSTIVTPGSVANGQLTADDCIDDFNEPARLYDSYEIWLEAGEAVSVSLTADFPFQHLRWVGDQFGAGATPQLAGETHVFTVHANEAGPHRFAVYTDTATPEQGGGYTMSFVEPMTSPAIERQALVALYEATDGDNWTDNTNWTVESAPVCSWYGVRCGATGNVLVVQMPDNNLSGHIPAEIGNLSQLVLLHLGQNALIGSIPATIGNLTNLLGLVLHSNQLDGEIPVEIGTLENLTTLYLLSNELSGELPAELGNLSKLRTLNLSANRLSGDLPVSLLDLTALTSLNLGGNCNDSSDVELIAFVEGLDPNWNVAGENCPGSGPAPDPEPEPVDQVIEDDIDQQNEELEAIVVEPDAPVTPEVVQQVNAVLEKSRERAGQTASSVADGTASIDTALSALGTMNRTLTVTSTVRRQGGQIQQTSVVDALEDVATVFTAMSSRAAEITPEQRAAVQEAAGTTLTSSAEMMEEGSTNDELVNLVAATSSVLNAAADAGAELSTELAAQAEQMVNNAVKQGVRSFAADIDVEDPAQVEALLASNPDAMEFAIAASVSVRSRIKPDAQAIEDELDSRGLSAEVGENLTNVLNAVSNPDGVTVGDGSATGAMLAALTQFITSSGLSAPGITVMALSNGDVDIEVDALTGGVMISTPTELYHGVVVNTRIVSGSMPKGVSFMRDGRGLLVASGLAIEIAPVPMDLVGFVSAVRDEGFEFNLRDNGSLEIALGNGQRFFGVAAYDNLVGVSGSCGELRIKEPSGAARSPGHAYALECANGAVQRVVPFVHSPLFYQSVADTGVRSRTDRNTGIITITDTGRFKPGFYVSPLSEADKAYRESNANHRGVALRTTDINNDGVMDMMLITADGIQPLYGL